ncbi:MAG: PAS domain-containing sensor histidine kinase [Candidatus Zixiibacteriota bacterium]|nr:MAG: PAS domain-containing sensor histidine kinase [candidate division Zixibacteria bacterium]
MKRRPLFWKVYPYYFFVIFISLLLAALYGAREMRTLYIGQLTSTLEARARVAERLLKPLLSANETAQLDRECKEISRVSSTRITVVDARGVVLGDSHEDPLSMENHGTRPEIVLAYGDEVGVKTRYSNTRQANMMYVAIPVKQDNEVIAVVRVAVSVSAVENVLTSFYRNIAIGGVLIMVLAALISMAVLKRLTNPLRELRNGAGRFAAGNLDSRLPVPTTEEIADLSESMNKMAEQLDVRIKTIAQQRNEREAILSSMSEGIVALDADQKIVLLNRVVAGFLNLDITESRGETFYEVIRIPLVLEFVERAMHSTDITEMEIKMSGVSDKYFQARAAALKDSFGEKVGVVVVFNDITRLKKLESIRRDFVANVSHELRTPITAITGSVETLLDGAMDNSDDNRRFMEMIARHSDRLNSLIEDLLSLAQIESETEQIGAGLTRISVSDVIASSLLACQEKSRMNEVNISSSCDPNLEANINRGQLEQAITNLIDNAIKYSNRGSTVDVEVTSSGDEIVISVQDRGVGIAAEHLPRLFERFYRVDEARSRDAGGTGLGLAIVKHVAVAHKGRVSVDSILGKGSSFRIHLPRTQ